MDDFTFIRSNIINTAIKFGEGTGKTLNVVRWIIDNREILLHPEILAAASRLIWDKIKKYTPTVVAGLEMAGVPLAIGVMYQAYSEGYTSLRTIIVRKEPKEYGRLRQIEGEALKSGDRVVIIDDIVSYGKTTFKAVQVLGETPAKVVAIVALLNYKRKGDLLLRSTDIPFDYVYDLIEMGMKYIEPWESKLDIPLQWKTKINHPTVRMIEGGPLIYNHRIYIPTDRCTFMVANMAGNILNEFPLAEDKYKKGSRSVPCVHNGKVYFGAYGGGLYIYDIASGTLTNPTIPNLVRIHSNPLIIGNCLIITDETNDKPGGGIFCLNVEDLSIIWHIKTQNYVVSTPTYIKATNTVVFGSNDYRIYCIDLSTGNILWQYYTGGEVKANIAYENGRCYAGSFSGYLYCLNVSDGSLIWRRKIGHRIFFNPIVSDNNVLIASDSHKFLAINKHSGNITWITSFKNWCQGQGELYKNLVFVGSADSFVYALCRETGQIKWRYKTEDEVGCFLVISDDRLYVTSWDGNLYCFDLAAMKSKLI